MFNYFGYGSNINLISLNAKGVKPLCSEKAVLKGWRLKFNVEHWFRHEGGVGNIEPGNAEDFVEGVLHKCEDEHLGHLDLMESYGIGYTRTEVEVKTSNAVKKAITYIGLADYIDNECLPTSRYLNIIIAGATEAKLSPTYLQKLRSQPVKRIGNYPEFRHPATKTAVFTKASLNSNKNLTALGSAVFNMENCRPKLRCLIDLFGGKDMTLFHIKRHDSSTGKESLDDYLSGNISDAAKNYLNTYLHEYQKEFEYIGRYLFDEEISRSTKTINQSIKFTNMKNYHDAMPHGEIKEIFKDVFFVSGTMKNEFFGSMWQFSRNMTVIREDGKLSLINTVRLSEEGLAALEKLGSIVNVVRLGDMHGVDDPFYLDRYNTTYWTIPGMRVPEGVKPDKELKEDGEMPFNNASFFEFKTTKRPEGIIRLDREGGIMIACDSLQNWTEPDQFFDKGTVETMTKMDFFVRANLGLAWLHESEPKPVDFENLKKIPFEHALCGHGYPLVNNAAKQYHTTFKRMFNV
ncbi:AIG2 family protein [Gillisia sp. Hel_I_86]|uniref:gamma-glutamylcyclotransferase family protein n=1 Tax=Gillisia sp. Hel_I_86 TaxID=1249981 RepID=UPI00119B797F|nr:gamma-glutamylcyclotransferase family protein [Gillisia sp. Hel_I_86]TVZ28321.1 AIG2 family protein [Gillisia sp. Hel_I_86]